jgi:hypothetical protein
MIKVEQPSGPAYANFMEQVAHPYFSDLFQDLSKRDGDGDKLSRSTWLEYCNLSGMLSERLYSLMDPKAKGYISKANFLSGMDFIFMSDLETKLKTTFQMYDFNNDGFITPEDVRILLLYAQFNRDESPKTSKTSFSAAFEEREEEHKEITAFIEKVFDGKKRIPF